jgi:formyltetrahydrofolate-dependent phosphoribosylglycinamide formyltransferase
LRLAVLISGSGSTLRNILDRCRDGRLRDVEVVGVLASRECNGLAHAREFGIAQAVVPRSVERAEYDLHDFSTRVTSVLDKWQPDLLVFAGFLSQYILPAQYVGRALNIHPALLPDFGGRGMYGDRVHAAVLASGATVSGATVHLVSDDYDGGPVIAQCEVPVLLDDTVETLGARVREAERELYPAVIQQFADGKLPLPWIGAA